MINFASPNVFDYQKNISKPSYTVRSASWHKERYNKTQPIDWVSLYQDHLDNMVRVFL